MEPESEKTSGFKCICVTCGTTDHSPEGSLQESLCINGHDDWLEYHDLIMASLGDNDYKKIVHRAKKRLGKNLEELQEIMKGGICI